MIVFKKTFLPNEKGLLELWLEVSEYIEIKKPFDMGFKTALELYENDIFSRPKQNF